MKKKLIIFISSILILITSTITVFGLFSGVFRKYPTIITISNVSFLYNNTSYLNEITTDNLNITKGEPTNVELRLETTGNENIIADYTVSLYAIETSENNTSLASAIDLYIYNGYRYEYVGALSDFTSENEYQITGTCLSNTASTISLQLVYNEAISDAYYTEALNNSITIKTDADASISLNSEFYTFVSSASEFKTALTETNNKEIVLTKDVTIDEPLSGENNGIDLNGHKLTLNKNVSITYTSEASTNLYIGDLSNEGSIEVSNDAKISVSGKAVNVYNKFISYVTLNNTTEQEALLKSSLYTIFEERIKEIPTKKEYAIADSFPLFDGYYNFLSYITINSDLLEKNENGYYVIKDYSKLTDYSPILYLTINSQKLSSQILVSDIGVNACIEELKTRFKDKNVNYSIPLINYDNKTRCHIEYIIDDNNSGIILNSDGIYQANGIDSIKALSSISVIKPTITVKVSYEHAYITYTLSEEETCNLIPFTELQFKSLILSNEAKILVCNPDSESLDTTISYGDNALLTDYLSKFKNSSATISSVQASDETYKDNISIDTTNKTIKAKDIENNKVIKTSIAYTATFNFENVVTYTFDSFFNVTLLGKEEYKTRYDISNRLSSKFRENDYISGNGYNFTAYGSLSPTVNKEKKAIYIKYEILTEEAKDYVAIIYQYNLVTQSESQVSYFAKNSDGSYLFSTSELTSATLNGNTSYFIDITSLEGFDGDKYSITDGVASASESGTYALAYAYEAFIQIKANLVPQVEATYVSVKASLYNDIAYTDPYIENNSEVSYTFTLTVEGIIHYGNLSGNVSDYILYSNLLLMFDSNSDGLITYSESKQSMSDVLANLTNKGINNTYYKTDSTYNSDYLYFDSFGISTLQGLENFTNITGLSFNGNSIKSIESLRSLHSLKYISFNNNLVTDIEPLNLLDDLVYVSFDSNLITDITSLKYLSKLQYVNLNKNKIVDLDGLTLLTNLKYLNLCNMTKNSTEFTNSNTISYELALIQVNSSSAEIYTGSGNGSEYSLSDEDKIAVTILKELERINRVNQKLYLPSRYYTNDNTYYNINWTCNNSNLVFTRDDNSSYYSFSCVNDVINENVEFYIQVGDKAFQRVMNVNVYKTGSTTVYDKYIYNGSGYTNLTTLTDVNKTLIDALFNVYNIDKSTSTLVEVVSGESVPEQFVISASDFDKANTISEIDLSNIGITSLKGLEYFTSYIDKNTNISINLLGNSLDSLEELTKLDTIGTLKIGSAEYDFNELLSGTKEDNNEVTLISISNLYVNQCYNLSDYDVLKGLFRYYFVSSNNINIYLVDDSTVWDPYTELLPYKMTLIEDNITLYTIGDYDLASIFYTDTNGIAIDFYGYTHYFKFDFAGYGNTTIYTRNQNDSHPWGAKINNVDYFYSSNDFFTFNLDSILTYKKYISGDETSYLVSTLKSTTNSKQTISTTHTIEINVFDIAKNLTVTGLDNNTSSTLADMFNSKELKEKIIDQLVNNGFSFSSTKTITLSDLQTKNIKLKEFTFTQMASNYSSDLFKGLHYLTSLKKITVNFDFYIGSGEELVNLESITASESYVDFSVLTSSLPNLTSLTFKNNYGIIMPSLLGDKLPNLSTLKIDSFKSNYMDLHALTNLITSDGKSNISTLKLNKVKDGSYPLTIGDMVNVIIPLRNAYYKANNSEPSYCVGDRTSGNASDTVPLHFVLNTDSTVNYVYVNEDSQENRWNQEVTASNTEITLESKDTSSQKIYDFGLMVGGDTPASGTAWVTLGEEPALKQVSGTSLWLPTNTKYFLYALYNDDTLISNNLTYSNLDMKWYYFKHDTSKSTKGEITGDTTNGYIKYSLSDDAYYIIIGTIPNKNLMFTYQFISGNGDGVYSSFTNSNLRFITYYFAELEDRIKISYGVYLNSGEINHKDFATYSGIDGLNSCGNWGSSIYSDKISISSLADYENDKINEYLFGENGKFQQMKVIKLQKSYYNISFTNTFGKLKNVETVYITYSTIIFDEDSFKNYTKLTSLTLYNASNFSSNSLKGLTSVNTCLTYLYIDGSLCGHNLDALTVLGDWTTNTKTITIALNSNTVKITTAKIKENLERIANDLTTNKTYDISKTDNYLGYIYANRTNSTSYNPNGTTYTLNWTYANQFITSIGNTNLTSNSPVDVSVLVSDSSFKIFNEIRYSFKAYNSQVSSNGKFKCDANANGLGIEDLNYELLAYAIYKGAISYTNGYFMLTKDLWLNSDNENTKYYAYITNTNLSNFIVSKYGDDYLKIQLTNNGNGFYIYKKHCYGLYNEYETNKLYRTGSNDNTTYTKNTILEMKHFEYDFISDDITSKTNPYIYFDNNTEDNKVVLTISLPANKIVIYGVEYTVKFDFESDKYKDYGIEITDSKAVIDSAKLLEANKFDYNTNTAFKFRYYIEVNGKKIYSNNCTTVYINHLNSDDTYIDENYLYILAQKDNTGYYLETNTNKVYFDSSKYVLANVSNGTYTLSDSGSYALINASYIFESGVFIKKIIDGSVTNEAYEKVNVTTLSNESRQVGKVLTNISTVGELFTDSGSYDYITSIKGIEYFKSLKILQLSGMIYGSLEGLENIALERFFYNTNSANQYVTIEDFSPLIKGSKDSLITLQYGAKGNTIMSDLSFVLEFSNLKNFYFENMEYNSKNYYAQTKEFAYLVYQLRNRSVNVYIEGNNLNSKYLNKNTFAWSNVYTTKVNDNYTLGFELLSLYDSNLAKFEKSPTFENDYSIKIDKSDSDTYIYLPATIESDGKLYLLNYTTDTYNKAGFISNLGYFNISGSTEEEVTDPNTLVSSNDYYLTYLARTSMLYVKFKVSSDATNNAYDKTSYNTIDVSLTCGMDEKKYSLSRRLTINFN